MLVYSHQEEGGRVGDATITAFGAYYIQCVATFTDLDKPIGCWKRT